MNLVIDQEKLLQHLANAAACTLVQAAGHDGEVSIYLIEHVLQPMREGRFPVVGDLDFSAFDIDELEEFGDYIKNATQMSSQIASWCRTFQTIDPIAQKQRAFC